MAREREVVPKEPTFEFAGADIHECIRIEELVLDIGLEK